MQLNITDILPDVNSYISEPVCTAVTGVRSVCVQNAGISLNATVSDMERRYARKMRSAVMMMILFIPHFLWRRLLPEGILQHRSHKRLLWLFFRTYLFS